MKFIDTLSNNNKDYLRNRHMHTTALHEIITTEFLIPIKFRSQGLLFKAAHLYGKSCRQSTRFLLNDITESKERWVYMDLCMHMT
jgi:hypothetical protein